jgi:hypothetical protein
VTGIKFELEPPRVAILKLARTDWQTGELLRNDTIYVKYHDVENVVDFLILRHMYDKAIRRKWNEGDRYIIITISINVNTGICFHFINFSYSFKGFDV